MASDLLPWEHATSGLCCKAAEDWLAKQVNKDGRPLRKCKRVHVVEWWAVFYESPEGEARHQRWELKGNQLVLAGPALSGWPVAA